jgi:hypothetical protein
VAGNELILCVVKWRILHKCQPLDSIQTTATHIILVRDIQEMFGDIIEMVRTLVYGSL